MNIFKKKRKETDFYDQLTMPILESLIPILVAFFTLVLSLCGLLLLKKRRRSRASVIELEPQRKKVIVYKKRSD